MEYRDVVIIHWVLPELSWLLGPYECSQEVGGGRPRLCPAGRVLAEPPGNHVMKIGGSTKTKSCRPCLPEHGTVDVSNKSGSNFEVDIRGFAPGQWELQIKSIWVFYRWVWRKFGVDAVPASNTALADRILVPQFVAEQELGVDGTLSPPFLKWRVRLLSVLIFHITWAGIALEQSTTSGVINR